MTVEIELSWWLVPTGATALLLVWAWFAMDHSPAHDYGAIGKGLGNLIVLLGFLLLAAICWVAYLSLRLWRVI